MPIHNFWHGGEFCCPQLFMIEMLSSVWMCGASGAGMLRSTETSRAAHKARYYVMQVVEQVESEIAEEFGINVSRNKP